MLNRLDEASKSLLCLDHFNLVSSLALELVNFDHTTEARALMHRMHELIDFVRLSGRKVDNLS